MRGIAIDLENSWSLRARCIGYAHMMFPEEGSTKHPMSSHRKALYLCFNCPVRRECFDDAVENRERWGIWGGTTQEDRKALFTSLKLAPKDQHHDLIEELRQRSYASALRWGLVQEEAS